VSGNPNITWEIIQANPNHPWCRDYVSSNPNITREIIHAHPEIPWNWVFIFCNRNLTFDWIREAEGDSIKSGTSRLTNDPWNVATIAKNPMENEKNNFLRNKLREWFARSNLKEELMATVWHPRNVEKFKCLDPDTFGSLEEEEM
jgi:hypothetical protein